MVSDPFDKELYKTIFSTDNFSIQGWGEVVGIFYRTGPFTEFNTKAAAIEYAYRNHITMLSLESMLQLTKLYNELCGDKI